MRAAAPISSFFPPCATTLRGTEGACRFYRETENVLLEVFEKTQKANKRMHRVCLLDHRTPIAPEKNPDKAPRAFPSSSPGIAMNRQLEQASDKRAKRSKTLQPADAPHAMPTGYATAIAIMHVQEIGVDQVRARAGGAAPAGSILVAPCLSPEGSVLCFLPDSFQ